MRRDNKEDQNRKINVGKIDCFDTAPPWARGTQDRTEGRERIKSVDTKAHEGNTKG
jgi:hypothetical protein